MLPLANVGDAHTTLETALQNFASAPFFTKWAMDIGDIQGKCVLDTISYWIESKSDTSCQLTHCAMPRLPSAHWLWIWSLPSTRGSRSPCWIHSAHCTNHRWRRRPRLEWIHLCYAMAAVPYNRGSAGDADSVPTPAEASKILESS